MFKHAATLLLVTVFATQLVAKDFEPGTTKQGAKDSIHKKLQVIHPWCVDLSLLGGYSALQTTNQNLANGYLNAINPQVPGITIGKGVNVGLNGTIGYFFGKKQHFGIGTGLVVDLINYKLYQNKFDIQYQSTDSLNRVFRQLLSSRSNIYENVSSTRLGIPLVFKYKAKLSKKFGINTDIGFLYNVFYYNAYSENNALFTYQAIYNYSPYAGKFIYDNGIVPGKHDIFITAAYAKGGQVSYFASERAQGFNVGLNQSPLSAKGSTTYSAGSLGLLVQPTLSYQWKKNIHLFAGLQFVYIDVERPNNNYKITDKVGSYNSKHFCGRNNRDSFLFWRMAQERTERAGTKKRQHRPRNRS